MLPANGPQIFKVAGIDAPVAGGATLGPIPFLFPRDLFVTGVLLVPTSGLRADMAQLRLRIQDETYEDLISDGLMTFDASVLALCGTTPLAFGAFGALVVKRPFVLQRPVASGDMWRFSVRNVAGGTLSSELFLFVEEPHA